MELDYPEPTQKETVQPERKKLNVVVISDTHGSYSQLKKVAGLSGDIFIHAGDFTDYGKEQDFLDFFKYLERLNFRYKVVIAGNHEIMLDNGCISHKKKCTYLRHHKCSVRPPLLSSARKK